jgi:hypothetical protein
MGRDEEALQVPEKLGNWLVDQLASMAIGPNKTWMYSEFQQAFSRANLGDFNIFWQGKTGQELRDLGLIVV